MTKKHLSRRTVLRGMGVTMALPFLEAMVPARHGAGEDRGGQGPAVGDRDGARLGGRHRRSALQKNLWSPAAVGKNFDLAPTSLTPLEPWREHVTIVSNTDVRNAEAFETPEIGGDHFRSSAVFLTQAHPRQTKGSNVFAGTSLDQYYAQQFGQETAIPSMQLCIEAVDQAGGCSYGYSCVYTDTISWAAPNQPLPMIRDPRFAFDQLFGVGATPEERRAAPAGRSQHPRLDHRGGGTAAQHAGRGRSRPARRLPRRSARGRAAHPAGRGAATTAAMERELPGAPAGVPDSFSEHVKLMFDLQALAFAGDTTRVFSFKLGRDASSRAYPESGTKTGVPPGVASRRARGADPRLRQDQHLSRQHGAVLPREAEATRPTATATCSTTRSSSSARRWATRTCTTTSAARCSWPAMPAAVSRAACT